MGLCTVVAHLAGDDHPVASMPVVREARVTESKKVRGRSGSTDLRSTSGMAWGLSEMKHTVLLETRIILGAHQQGIQ